MASPKLLTTICGWILFLFGCFCLADGAVALVSGSPCWIVRLAIGLAALLLTSVVALLKVAQLRILITLSGWTVFVSGCLCLVCGIFTRFTRFDDFKVWQWSMALGGIAIFLTAIIAFLGAKLETRIADDRHSP